MKNRKTTSKFKSIVNKEKYIFCFYLHSIFCFILLGNRILGICFFTIWKTLPVVDAILTRNVAQSMLGVVSSKSSDYVPIVTRVSK